MNGAWVAPDTRDAIVDFVRLWSTKTDIPAKQFVAWLGLREGRFYDWCQRYGKVNEHNAWIPRDHWLEDWEKLAILAYADGHPLDGYRRMAFDMIDKNIVCASPSSVYRVLKAAGLLGRRACVPSKKGTGFDQPLAPHEHWHTDISYINICATFYYLCTVLDGYSRYIVHWEIRESMTEREVEIVIQRGREKFPRATPRIISDNGPQFIAREFKEFIRLCGMTHVRTSPFYPQSNGKMERWHRSLKSEGIRPFTPLSLEDAWRVIAGYVRVYCEERLHSAIGYVTPKDKLEGRELEILAERDRRLEEARQRRAERRQQAGQDPRRETAVKAA